MWGIIARSFNEFSRYNQSICDLFKLKVHFSKGHRSNELNVQIHWEISSVKGKIILMGDMIFLFDAGLPQETAGFMDEAPMTLAYSSYPTLLRKLMYQK